MRSRCLSLAIAAAATLVAAHPRVVRADDVILVESDFQTAAQAAWKPAAQDIKRLLPYVTSRTQQEWLARSNGLTEIAGRPLHGKVVEGSADSGPEALVNGDFDHMVSGDATSILGQQRNASVAVNPIDQDIVVVIAENTHSTTGNSTDCSLYLSLDGGATYSYLRDNAYYLQAAPHSCASPRALFSPDGTVLYISNLELGATSPQGDVLLVAYDGFTFAFRAGFAVASAGLNTSNSIGVHTWDSTGTEWDRAYLTYTNINGGACTVQELTATGYGVFAGATQLAASANCTGAFPTGRNIAGPTIAGGPSTQVLACWFDSGIDGYSTTANPVTVPMLNKFNIACRSSNDGGLTFAGDFNPPESVNPPDYTKWIYAAKDVSSEVPWYVGPNSAYFDIRASQFPTSAIDYLGTAHIAFSYGISANRLKTDNANAAYIQSTAGVPTATAPVIYSKWSPKTSIATGPGDQLYPTVVTQRALESSKPYVYVAWIDTGAASKLGTSNANLVYDARYRLSKAGGKGFGKAVIAADHASISDFLSVGDYLGASASQGIFHFVWTDNRFSTSRFSPKEHIFGERY